MGLSLRGATSGAIDINAPAVAGDNTITLPPSNGGANQFFKNSGTAGIVTYSSVVENGIGNIGIGTAEFNGFRPEVKLCGINPIISIEDQFDVNSFSFLRQNGGAFTIITGDNSSNTFKVQKTTDTVKTFVGGNTTDLFTVDYVGNTRSVGQLVVGPSGGIGCTITTAGAVNVAGNIQAGVINGSSTSVSGTRIYAGGEILIQLPENSTGDVFSVYNGSSSTVPFQINATGDTTMRDLTVRTVTSSDQVISNRSGTSVCFRAQDSGTDNFKVKASGALDANGRGDFGTTTLNDYAIAGFTSSALYGGIYAQNDDTGGNLYTGQADGSEVFKVTATGSATFTGAVSASTANLQSSATNSWFQTGVSINANNYVWAAKDSSANVWHSGLQTGQDLYLGGNLVSGNNIKLGGSDGSGWFTGGLGIGGNAAANTMDEYEEGTFTPTYGTGVTSPTYDIQQGHYVRVGRLVSFVIGLRADGGTPNSSALVITGLPFTTLNSANSEGGAFMVYNAGIIGSNVTPTFYMPVNTVNVEVYTADGSSAWTGNSGNDVMNRTLRIRGQYYTS